MWCGLDELRHLSTYYAEMVYSVLTFIVWQHIEVIQAVRQVLNRPKG